MPESKIQPTGRRISPASPLNTVRANVLDKKYLPERQKSGNKKCVNGHLYLAYRKTCPKCGEE